MPHTGNLYHWRNKNAKSQEYLSWGNFFDIVSLQSYIPVIEMYEFVKGMYILVFFFISYYKSKDTY